LQAAGDIFMGGCDFLCVLDVDDAGLREAHPPSGSDEKRKPERFFEELDVLGDRWLRDVQHPGSFGNAVALGDTAKDVQAVVEHLSQAADGAT
jgi:hypothetical protein